MRWFLNVILVLMGLPVIAITFVLIAIFVSPAKDEIPWSIRLCLFAAWLSSLTLFTCAYVTRTRWLKRHGIYTSWSNFEAYVKENHWHSPVPEEEKTEFLSWAGLSAERPARLRKTMHALYDRIHAEAATEEQRRSYIQCLAWYAEGWPVHEDCYDVYEDDNRRVPAKNA